MKMLSTLVLLALGCATTSNRASDVPEAGRARWVACHAAVEEHCHHLGSGDPSIESQCERGAAREYSALTTDEAREQYLTSHGCRAAQ